MSTQVIGKRKKNPKVKLRFNASRDIPVYLLLLPALVLIIVFHYGPIYGIVIAFKDFSPFKGIWGSEWVGLKHFRYFLTDTNFWRVMRNTIVINVYFLIFLFPAPIILALLLNEVTRISFKRIVQTISYLPYFISWVVAAGIITTILSPSSGIVNTVLHRAFGLEPVYFLADKRFFRGILVVSAIWKGVGMSSVYYLAALTSIDPQLYEAAVIDGAGKLKQTWYITLPGLASIATILFVLTIGHLITIGFEQIFLLYNPLVYDVGDVISTYTYRLGLVQMQYSLTTAIGFTQSIISFGMVYTANKLARRVAGWSLW